MDRKEKKRDISTFTHMLKELMNDPLDDTLNTLDRDIQHFIYGRIATLVKHNDSQPIGSIADISAVVGVAFAEVIKELTRERVDSSQLTEVFQIAKNNLLSGFEARIPVETEELVENDTSIQ